jgi:hypothetical protein
MRNMILILLLSVTSNSIYANDTRCLTDGRCINLTELIKQYKIERLQKCAKLNKEQRVKTVCFLLEDDKDTTISN